MLQRNFGKSGAIARTSNHIMLSLKSHSTFENLFHYNQNLHHSDSFVEEGTEPFTVLSVFNKSSKNKKICFKFLQELSECSVSKSSLY